MSIEFAEPAITKKIIICPTCEGRGTVPDVQQESGHNFELKKKPCDRCGTSGRLIETTTIRQKPFKGGIE